MNYDPNNLNSLDELRNKLKNDKEKYMLNLDDINLKKYFPNLDINMLSKLSVKHMPRNGRTYYVHKETNNVYSKSLMTNEWIDETNTQDWEKVITANSFLCL